MLICCMEQSVIDGWHGWGESSVSRRVAGSRAAEGEERAVWRRPAESGKDGAVRSVIRKQEEMKNLRRPCSDVHAVM